MRHLEVVTERVVVTFATLFASVMSCGLPSVSANLVNVFANLIKVLPNFSMIESTQYNCTLLVSAASLLLRCSLLEVTCMNLLCLGQCEQSVVAFPLYRLTRWIMKVCFSISITFIHYKICPGLGAIAWFAWSSRIL